MWVDEAEWELSPEDVAEDLEEASVPPPVVAVVGRPNVGKSTLVNRILGRREAVVQDVPGVTRDRVSYDANWLGRRFFVQDTGGWEPDAKGLQQLVAEQATVAMATADAIILVVDAVVGATTADEAAAKRLQRTQASVPGGQQGRRRADRGRGGSVVVARAGRAVSGERTARSRCGRSARRGDRGVAGGLRGGDRERGPRRVALVGKPNVGKRSLLNRLSGEDRSVVDDVAGTTMDPVDSLVESGRQDMAFRRTPPDCAAGGAGAGRRVLRIGPHPEPWRQPRW